MRIPNSRLAEVLYPLRIPPGLPEKDAFANGLLSPIVRRDGTTAKTGAKRPIDPRSPSSSPATTVVELTLLKHGILRGAEERTTSGVVASLPPLVVSSGLEDDSIWAEVLNLGGCDVLAKPFNRREVFDVLAMAWLAWHDGQFRRRPSERTWKAVA